MEKYKEKSHQEIVAELDGRVEKMSRELAEEGYKFELTIPNESMVVLKVGGRD